MSRLSFRSLQLFVVIAICSPVANSQIRAIPVADVKASLERSLPYLQQEGRKWYEGEVSFQKNGGCISCHQVPSGIWSLASAYTALDQPGDTAFEELLSDSADFASDPDTAVAAAVSQLLLAEAAYQSHLPERTVEVRETLTPFVLESQNADGSWSASGQYPLQQRPIEESDSVVTMWMIRALRTIDDGSPAIVSAIQKAQQFVEAKPGVSSEWISWRLILSDEPDESKHYRDLLISHQNEDGSWGFIDGVDGEPYSTGVAIFALLQRQGNEDSTVRGIHFLLAHQSEDGNWPMKGNQISKKDSPSRDYVYRYWGTAWAAMGLARYIVTQDDQWENAGDRGAPADSV